MCLQVLGDQSPSYPELLHRVDNLEQQVSRLRFSCQSLKDEKDSLMRENAELKEMLFKERHCDHSEPSPLHEDTSMNEDDDTKLYENQMELGTNVVQQFYDSPSLSHMMIYAPTQSGKTGASVAISNKAIELLRIPPANIFVITGVNLVDWTTQTKRRFNAQGVLPEKNILKIHDLKVISHMF
jgi:regulator of replication initiation timing